MRLAPASGVKVHPTAIVDPGAVLGPGVEVGPYSVIEDGVEIGAGCWIGPHVVIKRFTTMGARCRVFQFASVGEIPQDMKFKGEESRLVIGAGNTIREFVTLNRGTEGGGGVTRIGDGNLLMAYVHVAHDCTIGSGCVLANAATLAGHITIGDRAIIGGLVGIHQFVRVGELAFIGGMTAVRQDVPPYTLCMGDPMRLTGLNLEGLKRARFPAETVSALKEAYRVLVRSGATTPEAAARVRRDVADLPEVRRLVEFFETSKRGIPRKAAKE